MSNQIITHFHEDFSYVEYNGSFFKGCKRCGGTGHYSFNGFDSICYNCGNSFDGRLGDAFDSQAEAIKWCHGKAVRRAQAARKREAERVAKIAKRNEAWTALKDQSPAVWDLLSTVAGVTIPFDESQYNENTTERSAFVRSMADKLFTLDKIRFTARQIEALEDIAAKRVAEAAVAAETPAPSGRVVVTGEISSVKAVEGDYGTSYKMLVKADEGFKVWVALPKAQADQAYDEFLSFVEASGTAQSDWGYNVWFLGSDNGHYSGVKGRRITFTATLEPSRDDVSFAFGSRPTKGAWL